MEYYKEIFSKFSKRLEKDLKNFEEKTINDINELKLINNNVNEIEGKLIYLSILDLLVSFSNIINKYSQNSDCSSGINFFKQLI